MTSVHLLLSLRTQSPSCCHDSVLNYSEHTEYIVYDNMSPVMRSLWCCCSTCNETCNLATFIRSSPNVPDSSTCYRLKADSHITCRAHVIPPPRRAAKGLECLSNWFTQCGRVCFTLAKPRPCNPRPCRCSQGHGTAWPSREYLLAFGFFRLLRGVPRSCYQMHTNFRCRWPVWNQTPFIMDEGKEW